MHARTSPRISGTPTGRAPHSRSHHEFAPLLALLDGARMDRGSGGRAALELQRLVGNKNARAAFAGGSRGAAVAQRISAARSGGSTLDGTARGRLERSYGVDLQDVRVHADGEADALARGLDAQAFTSGGDVFFRSGSYAPSTPAGFRVLAHEVAHVVQQSTGPVPARELGGGLRVSEPADAGETAADLAADDAVAGVPAQRLPAGSARAGDGSSVQRCGPVPCDCPDEKKEAVAADEGLAPIQRMPAARGIVVQRKPLPNVPLGDLDLMFDPRARLSFSAPDGTQGLAVKDEAAETFTFTDVPRGARGQLDLDVAMQWFKKPDVVPPGPAGVCDVCGILAKALTVSLPFPLDLIFGNIEPPKALIDECRRLVRLDVNGIKPLLDKIEDAALDPCTKLIGLTGISKDLGKVFTFLCKGGQIVLRILPGGADSFIKDIQLHILQGVREARRALEKCKSKQPPAPPPGPATGQLLGGAQSQMRTAFVSEPDGSLRFTGLSPVPFQFGSGARLVIPVEHGRNSAPGGGSVQQQPTVTTTAGAPGVAARLFTAQVQQPADVAYGCEQPFRPFKVAKDVFEQDDLAHQQIRDWYFGLHPLIRQDIEEGRGLIRITGRASKTGSQAFNMQLAEKRAKRVKSILAGMTGSHARDMRVFFLGELGAQTPGCDGPVPNRKECEDAAERRADAVASGSIPGAGTLESPCAGHIGQPTPSGADFPVVEASAEQAEVAPTPAAAVDGERPLLEPAFA